MGMYQVDGKQYAIPFDLGMVGVWQQGSSSSRQASPPLATWDEFLADVDKLKAAGITPASVGGSPATWTEMFWWAYLALRECGGDVMTQATTTNDWTNPCFVEAGNKLKGLLDKEPFQEGFLAATWDGAGGSAATVAVEKAAMLLQGQWAPGTMQANTADSSRQGVSTGSRSQATGWVVDDVRWRHRWDRRRQGRSGRGDRVRQVLQCQGTGHAA
jgi:raffinose/stachyose/melibiose transport system substrate-binding protein